MNLSIRGRLIFTNIILVVLFILGMGYAYFAFNNIDSSMEEISEEYVPLAQALNNQLIAELELEEELAGIIDALKHGDADDQGHEAELANAKRILLAAFDKGSTEISAAKDLVDGIIEEATARGETDEAEEIAGIAGDLDELIKVRPEYSAAIVDLLKLYTDGASEDDIEAVNDEMLEAREENNEFLEDMAAETLEFVVEETEDIRAYSAVAILLLLYAGGFVIALVALFSYLSVASVSAPIKAISSVLDKLRSGDDAARTGYIGGDELHTLGFALDNLLDERRDVQQLDVEESDKLNNSIMNVLRSVSVLGQGDLTEEVPMAEDITGALGDAINQMTENMIETLELVTESSDNVINVSNNVNIMAQSGKDSVIKNTAAMNEIRITIQETAKRIKRLGERSQDISGIVKVINDISERTSVLALNANMQAAAAGEAGRGFMVVANEVQRLAESSQEATKQIGKLVNTIQTETGDTIVAMDKGIEEVVKGAELAEEAAKQMDKTVQTIENLNRVGAQLKASVNAFKLPESA